MTVSELIEELRKYSGDSKIVLSALPVTKPDYKCRLDLEASRMIEIHGTVIVACPFVTVSSRKFDDFWRPLDAYI